MKHEIKPALCLDLDGTIRYSKTGKFISSPNDIALYPGVEERIQEYVQDNYLVFGITNQAGVAYGFKSVAEVEEEIAATRALFVKDPFFSVKVAYNHEAGKVFPYDQRSLLRKPEIGMLVQCELEALEHNYIIDWDKSVFVGDRPEDKQCADNAGVQFYWAHDFFGREPEN